MRKVSSMMKNMNVRGKLIIIYLLTSLLPMCALYVLVHVKMQNILAEDERRNLESAFNRAVDELDTRIQLHTNMANYIVFNQTIAAIINDSNRNSFAAYERMEKEFDPLIDSLMYFYPDVKRITIYAPDQIIPHGSYLRPMREAAGQPWTELEDNRMFWYVDEENGSLCMACRMLLLAPGQKGFLYLELDYGKIFDSVSLDIDEENGIYIYNDDGQLFYSDADESKGNGYIDFETFLQEAENEGSEYEIMRRSIYNGKWQAGCYMHRDQIDQALYPAMTIVIVGWSCCMVISLGIIRLFSKSMSDRINGILDTMGEVKNGNLDVTVEEGYVDEIGELGRNFNRMLSEIRKLIREVYEGKLKQKQHEMAALRAQINPHFLYNSLSLLNWMALEREMDDMSHIALSLSRYYRTSLNKGRHIMTIREELDNVRAYLEIQKIMHDGSFQVEIDVEEGLMDLETLNLILQPLAENAVQHGIDMRRSGGGIIRIIGKRENDLVVLSVSDDGVGMSREKAAVILTSESSGYGVLNVNARIQLEYGRQYGLSVESREGEGTEVFVRFPAIKFHRM